MSESIFTEPLARVCPIRTIIHSFLELQVPAIGTPKRAINLLMRGNSNQTTFQAKVPKCLDSWREIPHCFNKYFFSKLIPLVTSSLPFDSIPYHPRYPES